jgi:hypothetical protein
VNPCLKVFEPEWLAQLCSSILKQLRVSDDDQFDIAWWSLCYRYAQVGPYASWLSWSDSYSVCQNGLPAELSTVVYALK